jgi:hypothetical protein
MNWHIGQDIVCIKTHSRGFATKGTVYTIKSPLDTLVNISELTEVLNEPAFK